MASLFDDPDAIRRQALASRKVSPGTTPESAILAGSANIGSNLGYGIARLFGRELPEVRAAQEKEQIMQDVLNSTDADGKPYTFGSLEFYDNVSQKLLDAGFPKEAFEVLKIRSTAATTANAAEDAELARKLTRTKIKSMESRLRSGSFSEKLSKRRLEMEKAPTDLEWNEAVTFLDGAGISDENRAFLNKAYTGQVPEEMGFNPARLAYGEENIPEETGISMFTDDDGIFTGTSTQSQIQEMVAREIRNRRIAGEEVTQATVNEIIDGIRNASSFTEVEPFGFGDKGFYKPNIQSPSKTKSDEVMSQSMQKLADDFLNLIDVEGMSPDEARGVIEDDILNLNFSQEQSNILLEGINKIQDELE
tara:strand:+ start:32 stop:1123 length:1092 start_codon:yes stop_codon:yes gene_type:complete